VPGARLHTGRGEGPASGTCSGGTLHPGAWKGYRDAALRVGFLIDRWRPERGGAERALAALAGHLEERGHEVLAFGLYGPRPEHPAPGRFVAVRVLAWTHLSRGSRERALGAALIAGAAEKKCDVTVGVRHLPRVDLYWPHGGSHAATLVALARARACAKGEPLPEGDDLEAEVVAKARGRHKTFLDLERRLLEGGGAGHVVCVSRVVQEELERAYPACAAKLVLIENGVDVERFHPREREAARGKLRAELDAVRGAEIEGPVVSLVARNPELKGLPTLLEALSGLTEPKWHLLVAGPKDVRRWKGPVKRLGLEGRVTLRPNLDPVVLAAGSDLYVLPSWRDPAPLSVLESLAAGTPVVTTRLSGGSELIQDGVAGEVIERPGDPESLRGALSRWIGRAGAGEVDREAVRACVRGRDAASWLGRLERLVLSLQKT
jgi:UDP-glucose:(heptosyl)LPS alpha-1,3-glucosyltransferase